MPIISGQPFTVVELFEDNRNLSKIGMSSNGSESKAVIKLRESAIEEGSSTKSCIKKNIYKFYVHEIFIVLHLYICFVIK